MVSRHAGSKRPHGAAAVHETLTLLTEPVRITPVPFNTTHVSPEGCEATVTLNDVAVGTEAGNVNVVAPGAGLTLSVPLARIKPDPVSPDMPPPSVNVVVAQLTCTSLTLPEPTTPLPPVTVQVWPAGWSCTVTSYGVPADTAVLKVKL